MSGANSSVKVYIGGDAGGVQRATRDAERALSKLRSSASSHFGDMTKVAGGFGLAMGAGGVVGVLHDSLKAFQESEAATAKATAQLRSMGLASEGTSKQIDQAIQAQSKFGAFDDEDLLSSFTRILRSTGDVTKSLKLNKLAMDISRGSGKSLAASAEVVAKAAGGNVAPLRKMGIQLDKNATSAEALRTAQQKFAGQAAEFGKSSAAGAERASIAWENAKEEIGSKLAPAFGVAATKGTELAHAVGDAASAFGGLQSIAVGGGLVVGVRTLGPLFANAAQGISAMRREAALMERVKLGQFDAFMKMPSGAVKIDTRSTAASIRKAYSEIGTEISRSQSIALAQAGRMSAPAGAFSKIGTAAKTAGGTITNALGGPLGVISLAVGGVGLGIEAWRSSLKSVEDKAKDIGSAIQHAIDLQASLADAELGVRQARMDAQTAERGRRDTKVSLRHAQQRFDSAVSDVAQGPSGQMTANANRIASVTKARRDLTAATRANAQATLTAEQASLRLQTAEGRVKDIHRERKQTAEELAARTRTLARDAAAQAQVEMQDYKSRAQAAGQLDAAFDKNAASAKYFAAAMREDASTNKGLNDQARATENAIATLAERLHRVPSETDAKIISDAVAKGEDVAALIDKLAGVPSSTDANVSTNAPAATAAIAETNRELDRLDGKRATTFVTTVFSSTPGNSPIPIGPAQQKAKGGVIPGRFDGRDNIPLWVSRGEVVLNPQHVSMIGPGRVFGALAATGAPTIGAWGGYAKGGKPTKLEEWSNRMDASKSVFDRNWARLDMLAARAEGTTSKADDRAVANSQRALLRRRISSLRRLLSSGDVPLSLRGDIYSEIAAHTREIRDLTPQRDTAPAPVLDEFRLARARTAGVRQGLGRLSSYLLGNAGDIGSGTSPITLSVGRLVLSSSPANVTALAAGSNAGNALTGSRRLYSTRQRIG